MNKTLLLALSSLLVLPSAASAATATADVERRQGASFGPVTFKAAEGERNRVTVTHANGRLRIRDAANRVVARGDCQQVNRRTALCPFTEDIAQIRLGDRADTATVDGLVEVLGGSGGDLLRGGDGGDRLLGDRGGDELHGRGARDVLTGGPGRDRLYGGGGDDDLIDGETDRQAARDLFRGGSSRDTNGADRGDMLDYSKRRRAVVVDLTRGRVASAERDVVRGLESVTGGSGRDRLSGDGDDNWLDGNGGADRLHGRGGDDIPMGGRGGDRVAGDRGDDTVWGDGGTDQLFGGDGADQLIGRDANAEPVSCGGGDDVAPVTRLDTLTDCERASSSQLIVGVHPEVRGNTATFQVACLRIEGCSGTIAIARLDGGESYGSGEFAGIPHGADAFQAVEVGLTPAGRTALQRGDLVLVTYPGSTGGYRAFIQRRA
jgi:Ca2+-binding RTX toxin-like protein